MWPEKTRRRPFPLGEPPPTREAPPPSAMEAARVWKAPAGRPPPRTFPHPLEIPLRPPPGIPTAPTAATARRRKATLDGENA
jgi:hypothetical protein